MYWTEYKIIFRIKSKILAEKIINKFGIIPKLYVSNTLKSGKTIIMFDFVYYTEVENDRNNIKQFLIENNINLNEQILELNNMV